MATMLFQTTQEARMVAMIGDDGDGQEPKPPAKVPDFLRYEERAETRTTQHTRTKSKVGVVTTRKNIVLRVDAGAEIVCAKLAVAQMTRGEWECWIALKEGILFDPLPKRSRGIVRRRWFVVPLPAKSATVEVVVRHYGYTERSVREMDRTARRVLNRFREAAGLIGDDVRVPIWPVVMNDETLIRHLFGSRAE